MHISGSKGLQNVFAAGTLLEELTAVPQTP